MEAGSHLANRWLLLGRLFCGMDAVCLLVGFANTRVARPLLIFVPYWWLGEDHELGVAVSRSG